MDKRRRMKVVLVIKGKPAQLKTVSTDLTELQGFFENEVKIHYLKSDAAALIYSGLESFVLSDKERLVFTNDKFIICGVSKIGFCSLTKVQQEKYLNRFTPVEIKNKADEQKRRKD